MATVSPIDPRLAPSIKLPEGFEYPAPYLQYLLAEEREFGEVNEWHLLQWVWPAYLHYEQDRVQHTLAAYFKANPNRRDFYLVPFAHDAGDGVWFFTPDGISFIDMGWSEWVPQKEDDESILAFINRKRVEAYYPAWRPD